MPERAHLRLQHLRHLTDRNGLLAHASFGEPDRFGGYRAIDNGRALRLTASLHDLGLHDDAAHWADIYVRCLFQGFRMGRGFSARREAIGGWSDELVGMAEWGEIARGLAAVANSELPRLVRDRAEALWSRGLPDLMAIRCPRAAAAWLLAIAEARPQEQRRLEAVIAHLADWMIEECYERARAPGWEWFDERWLAGDACLPHALWAAYAILGEPRYARVASETTAFLIRRLFEDGLFLPVGTPGGWHAGGTRNLFDQLPTDVAATTELLACAHDVGGQPQYAEYARYAHAWFTGNNVKGLRMLDDTTGGVYDHLSQAGHAPGQGAASLVSFLLSAVSVRRLREPRIVDLGTVVSVG